MQPGSVPSASYVDRSGIYTARRSGRCLSTSSPVFHRCLGCYEVLFAVQMMLSVESRHPFVAWSSFFHQPSFARSPRYMFFHSLRMFEHLLSQRLPARRKMPLVALRSNTLTPSVNLDRPLTYTLQGS